MLGVVFSMPGQEIGLGKRLRNDLFYVKWDVKPHNSMGHISGPCNSFYCLGHFKNVYDGDDDDLQKR